MKLSPKAQRFVIEAARGLKDSGAKDRLLSWISRAPQTDLPDDIAPTTLAALESLEAWMMTRLEASRSDENQEAEIINDIRFIQTLERGLKRAALQHA